MTKLTITRRDKAVSVTDGDNIRVEGCRSIYTAAALETWLKADLDGARRWMNHREPEQLDLSLIGGTAALFRRPEEDN